jgi:hypothetical protein
MGDLFGLQGGVPPSDDGAAGAYCNARADECSSGHVACGERIVYFRGAEYKVIGFYFVSTPSGGCELCYVLRIISDDSPARFSTETIQRDLAGSRHIALRRRGRPSTAAAETRGGPWRRGRRNPGDPPATADD